MAAINAVRDKTGTTKRLPATADSCQSLLMGRKRKPVQPFKMTQKLPHSHPPAPQNNRLL